MAGGLLGTGDTYQKSAIGGMMNSAQIETQVEAANRQIEAANNAKSANTVASGGTLALTYGPKAYSMAADYLGGTGAAAESGAAAANMVTPQLSQSAALYPAAPAGTTAAPAITATGADVGGGAVTGAIAGAETGGAIGGAATGVTGLAGTATAGATGTAAALEGAGLATSLAGTGAATAATGGAAAAGTAAAGGAAAGATTAAAASSVIPVVGWVVAAGALAYALFSSDLF